MFIQMEINIQVNSQTQKSMEMQFIIMKMETNIMEIGSMILRTDMVSSLFQVELDIKGSLLKINKMEKAFTNIIMGINIVNLGNKIKDIEKKYLLGKIKINI